MADVIDNPVEEEGWSLGKKLGCGAAVVGGSTAVAGGMGCAGLAVMGVLGAGALTCAGVGTGIAVAGYKYLTAPDTTEMTVAPGVKYAPNGVLNCRADAVYNSGVVTTFEPGDTVELVNDRPEQGDWAFTTEDCWVAKQLAGVPNLVVTE